MTLALAVGLLAPPALGAPAPPTTTPQPPAPEAQAGETDPAPGITLTAPARLAIDEFALDGEGAATGIAMQLEDAFVMGLLRGGLPALDSTDVSRKLETAPELKRCETSPCLKRLGQALDVGYLIRVRVSVTGNSYKAIARLFSTTADGPVVLPIVTQSRFCDVCTITEAREMMSRMADAVRRPFEEALRTQGPVGMAQAPVDSTKPHVALATGLTAVVAGIALFASAGDGKAIPALAGTLVGAGATVAAAGIYMLLDVKKQPSGGLVAGVQLVGRF